MSDPKVIKFGNCTIKDTDPDSISAGQAPWMVQKAVKSSIGCDNESFFANSVDGEKQGMLKKFGCDLVSKAMDHPAFSSTVKFFAKWKLHEYILKKGKEDLIGYTSMKRSPGEVIKELAKCVKK